MFTLFCYLFALVPAIVAGILWLFNKKVVWWEVLGVLIIGFITALIFNWLVIKGMTDDVETWSGQISMASYQPPWVESYEQAIYKTETYTETESYRDSHGNSKTRLVTKTRRVFSHWEHRTRHHGPEWKACDTLGGAYSIDQNRYEDIKNKFGEVSARPGTRYTVWVDERNSHLLTGDPNDYHTINKNNYVYPVTTTKTWENKVRACPSLFSFHKVEASASIPVNDYPCNNDKFRSDRLFGTANVIDIVKWDQLNSEVGPVKKINLIAVGSPNSGSDFGTEQEAAWVGGKKNDLVITFGGEAKKPSWVYVFGWTEQDVVKRNIETLILQKGFNNDIIPEIKQIVMKDYVIKDWRKFDYLTVEVPLSKYIWFMIVIFVVCGLWIVFSIFNDIDKENDRVSICGGVRDIYRYYR